MTFGVHAHQGMSREHPRSQPGSLATLWSQPGAWEGKLKELAEGQSVCHWESASGGSLCERKPCQPLGGQVSLLLSLSWHVPAQLPRKYHCSLGKEEYLPERSSS